MKTKIENLENYNFFIDERGNISGEAKIRSLSFKDVIKLDKKIARSIICYNQFSEESAKKLHLFSIIQAIADYANGDWVPDWNEDNNQKKFSMFSYNKSVDVSSSVHINDGMPCFKSEELAKQAYNDNKEIFDEFFSL